MQLFTNRWKYLNFLILDCFNVSSCFRNTGVVPFPCKIQTNSCFPLTSRHPPLPKNAKINLPPLHKAFTHTETLPMEELEVTPKREISASTITTLFHTETEHKKKATSKNKPKIVRTFNFYRL